MMDRSPQSTAAPSGAANALNDGLLLDAESVQCYLYALLDEAKRRGSLFPQSSNKQDDDSDAVHRVCEMVQWYGEQSEPRSEAVAKLRALRAANRK